jgi:hypothetical protein
MSNGNQNIINVIFNKIFGSGKSSALTSKKNEVILKFVKVHVLEMEDVLFHLNSCVLMPENPKGKSSKDGELQSDDESLDITGIKALALVFKQFEFDPDVKMIVTGHTDTSGTADFNFKLSDERAKNVLYLLTGLREEWAELCYNRHKVEDYQQIMKYFEPKLKCGCDPGSINDNYDDNTRKATKNFFIHLNPIDADKNFNKVNSDSKHRWHKEIWEYVFDLYTKEMAEMLEISIADLNARRKAGVKFVDDKKQFLGCGESFPIESKEKDNYRSQRNRRVELLFFDADEIPEINCPAVKSRIHTEDECPLWRKFYFKPEYIDPGDLKSLVYHLKFVYFDKIKKKQLPVPDGLSFKVYDNLQKEPIPSESIFKDGTYFIKVKLGKKINDPARTQFYFEFETTDKWIYTKDDKTDPEIVRKTSDEIKKLSYIERQNYYDLPNKWSSRNYWTRYDGDVKKGDRYEVVFKDKVKLKPFGSEISKKDKPLVFSLDDIVLVDTTKSQIISDKKPDDSALALNEDSRYSLFYIDYETEEEVDGKQKNLRRLKTYNPEESQPVFTDFKFKENLITDVPNYTRVVYFCNDFYDVGIERSKSGDASFDYSKKHVAGARIAVKNDPALQKSKSVIATSAADRASAYALTGCGNYEMHFFNDCAELDGKPLNYLIVYWNCRFKFDQGGTAADVTNHRKQGMKNAMDRMNKNYLVEKQSGSEDILIRLFFYMEAKNDTNGGSHKCIVSVTDNTNGAWMRTGDAKFRRRDYQSDTAYFGTPDLINSLQDVDGNTYPVLTNHHEMGHATGNWDSYLYNYESGGNNWTGLPAYNQPFTAIGGPYRFDELARMYHNRSPRIREYWKYVLWLNDESDSGKALNSFLKGSKYKITHQGKNHKHEFFLANDFRNVEIAARTLLDHSIAANNKVDLFIYKLGDDEFSIMAKAGQTFKGILVVKIRLAFRFIDTASGNWDFAAQLDWTQRFNNDAGTMLNKKFRIATNTNNDFKNLFVVFTPSYQVYTGVTPADSQYDIEISFQRGNNFNTTGKRIQVDWDVDKNRIIRYLFGKTTGASNLTKTDFDTIVNWVGTPGVCNATYNMFDL